MMFLAHLVLYYEVALVYETIECLGGLNEKLIKNQGVRDDLFK